MTPSSNPRFYNLIGLLGQESIHFDPKNVKIKQKVSQFCVVHFTYQCIENTQNQPFRANTAFFCFRTDVNLLVLTSSVHFKRYFIEMCATGE